MTSAIVRMEQRADVEPQLRDNSNTVLV